MKIETKRGFDVIVSWLVASFFLPVFLIIACWVWRFLGRPVLFRQLRPGLNGRPFFLYKFRTMTNETDETGVLLPDSERLFRFGKFLRATSMDELPELVNVIRGEMSLVGPRPLLMEYLPRYTEDQARRHEVKPGITGWAQINGRNSISWEEKFKLDVWYVDNWSLALDVKILLWTVIQVFKRKDIHQAGHVTAEPFMGSRHGG